MTSSTPRFKAFAKAAGAYIHAYPWNLLASLLLALWTQYILFGAGGMDFLDFRTGTDAVSAVESLIVLFVSILWFTHSRLARIVPMVLALVLAVVTPLYLMTGGPLITAQNVDTMLATDFEESWSFLTTVPLQHCIPSFVVGAVILTLLGFFVRPLSTEAKKVKRLWGLVLIGLVPIFFISTPVGDIGYSLVEGRVLQAKQSTWHVTGRIDRKNNVKNYVIVVGESLRADILQLYGSRFYTSPFLNSVPVKFVSTMVSPTYSTMGAVPLLLALPDEKAELIAAPENNVVALAHEAEMKTYWVSAQGRTGSHEIPITRIANSADEQNFEAKHDDFGLLPIVQKILATPTPEKRLIVVHLYGSHENTCDRVKDYKHTFETGKEEFLDCYLASAQKTDKILSELAKMLNASEGGWSMIFTSDHALEFHRDKLTKELICCRDAKRQNQFVVPFVELGSELRRTQRVNGVKSLMSFPKYFPTWIGVTTNKTPVGYNVFTPGDEPVPVATPLKTVKSWKDLAPGTAFEEVLK